MNRYETTRELLRGLKLNNFDSEQLAAVEASVLRLVADGTPTVEMVADSMGMHLSKFRRRVKAITGIAAADYHLCADEPCPEDAGRPPAL